LFQNLTVERQDFGVWSAVSQFSRPFETSPCAASASPGLRKAGRPPFRRKQTQEIDAVLHANGFQRGNAGAQRADRS
jgi:hypothetical protein